MSQAPLLHPMNSSINYNTVIVADQSHRGSLADGHRVGAASLEPPKAKNSGGQQPQQVTTSPIVGRYRLKHVQQHQNAANARPAHTGVPSKRQQQYEGQAQQRIHTDKRTKSVRPRRPNNGQPLGGSNLRGGGRRGREDLEQK